MKRILVVLLCFVLTFPIVAYAEKPDISAMTDQEKSELLITLLDEVNETTINELLMKRVLSYSSDALKKLQEIIANEVDSREDLKPEVTYQNGSKGEEVRSIQLRLIELNYLSGSADGAFGNMTEDAVKRFQQDANLTVTGIVNRETMKELFSVNAPKAKVYLDLDFKAISREPDLYKGKLYKFSGKVLQVLEGSSWGGKITVNLRVATKGSYDNVVYVVYERGTNESRILEDDRVTIYGECEGLYSYTAVLGNTITLPEFTAESITVNK